MKKRKMLFLALAILAFLCQCGGQSGGDLPELTFCCQAENDLYQVLSRSTGKNFARFETAAEAIAAAREGSGVLLLADGYPNQPTEMDSALFVKARAKRLRVYLEYPSAFLDLSLSSAKTTTFERAVVSSDFFLPEIEPLTILAIHDCHYIPFKVGAPQLALSRVAGFDKAVYGLGKETWPLLAFYPDSSFLISATKLSQFVSARYAPEAAWSVIWQKILGWACPGADVPNLHWTAKVRPSFGREEPLPQTIEAMALQRGANWFKSSRLLMGQPDERQVSALVKRKTNSEIDEPMGDGKFGILEGYASGIKFDGRQGRQINRRADCISESAMGLAFGSELIPDTSHQSIATNLLNFLYFDCVAQQAERANPLHPAFGLVVWGISTPQCQIACYGDDNARMMLATMAASALLESDHWDRSLLKCLLANLRTTGQYGFRTDRIDMPDISAKGWRYYFNRSPVNYAPHFEAYLWACYLWAYHQTGSPLFLQRAKTAIRMTMEAYPEKWRWTNGIAQERGRMLLPLAWLVRLEDTPEHRTWLRRVAADLLAGQDDSGAIREELGRAEMGRYGPPTSNEEYGVNEATLIQANGDPVCDLLYTTNFSFLGLHEAATATQDSFYINAEDKLAKFLCRIQVRSEKFTELDGAWFRAFDYHQWTYWGSSADVGWGAWSIETGWTQGWIVAVLGLRQMKSSLWQLTSTSRIEEHFTELYPMFFPQE